ncbi:hypothetical protein QQ045_030573 [Rhodiola kirilowii]
MLMVATRRLSSRSWRSPQPTSSTLISGNFHWVDTEKSNRSPLPANRDEVLIGNLIRGKVMESEIQAFLAGYGEIRGFDEMGTQRISVVSVKQMGFTATRNLSRKGICMELAIRGMALALILMKGGGGEWGRRGLIVQ